MRFLQIACLKTEKADFQFYKKYSISMFTYYKKMAYQKILIGITTIKPFLLLLSSILLVSLF